MSITRQEVALHSLPEDCWVILRRKVYNVTAFLRDHPGGAQALARPGRAGADVTAAFEQIGHSSAAECILVSLFVGDLAMEETLPAVIGKLARETCESNNPELGEHLGESLSLISPSSYEQADFKGPGWHWHINRRKAILEAHPEIRELLRPDIRTLFVIPIVALAHCIGCLLAQESNSFLTMFVLAYTLGAFCKMIQFAMAHELCHGTVADLFERQRTCKSLAMHLCALPALNNLIHDYYSFMHLGHHSFFGSWDFMKNTSLRAVALDQAMDGDALSVNVMKLIMRAVFSKMNGRFLCIDRDAVKNLHDWPYIKLFVFDIGFHISHGIGQLAVSIFLGLSFLQLVVLQFFAPNFLRSSLREVQYYSDGTVERDERVPEADVDGILHKLWHTSSHFWWWIAADAVLLRIGPCTMKAVLLGLFYLFLSELFYSGFLFHPYLAFWLATHGTGTGTMDGATTLQECQPTMSIYSRTAAALTANLTYHVEHHDFPKCPWTRLPQITALAPEFYVNLRTSTGMVQTILSYVRHGSDWRYGCLD